MKTDFIFEKSQDDKFNFSDQDLIELKAYGLSLNNDTTRPFLILKDQSGDFTLPVGISQIEAGVTLAQNNAHQFNSTPHAFLEKLISSLDIVVEKCVFSEIIGHHQFVRLFMKGHPQYQSFKIRADEAMSLCLHLKIPFFATKNFIHKSKIMSTKLTEQCSDVSFQQLAAPGKREFFH